MTEEVFIQNVTEQIRCVKAREGIEKELSDHIADQTAAYEEAGETHEEAVRKAVQEMGDPVEVGVELDRIHRPQIDFKMMGMALIFSILGYFIVCAVNAEGFTQYPDYVTRQRVILLLSLGVMAGMYFLDYTFIGHYAYGIYVFLTIAIYCSMIVSVRKNGIPIAFMLVYLYIPVYAGILYRLRRRGYGAIAVGIVIQIVTTMLVWSVSTMYITMNIYIMCMVLFVIALWKGWFDVDKKMAAVILIVVLVLLPAALLVCGIAWSGRMDGFRIQRLLAWLHPEKDAGGAGYIYMWLRGTLGTAKLMGPSESNPYMNGSLLNSYMPYPTEPFVLFQIICEYGILAGIIVVLAFVAVIVRAFQIVRRQKNQLGFMISAGCFIVLLINCLEGILINSGHYPVSSMQLPFVSQGACTAITYAAIIGLLLSVYRNERIVTDKTIERRCRWRLKINVKLEKR